MRLRTWTCVVLGTCLAPAVAEAGVLHGTLRVVSPARVQRMSDPYAGRASSMPGPHDMMTGRAEDAVIAIESVPAGADSSPRGPVPRLAQKDQCFLPRVLAIAVGDAVDFPNLDPIFHNVFSLSPVRRFDLGKYPRGQSRRVVFPKVGLVNVFCDIHSNMAAYILVLPNRWYAQPDEAGAWKLPPLPAGSYSVRVWHPDLPEIHRTVTVPATGSVALNLEL